MKMFKLMFFSMFFFSPCLHGKFLSSEKLNQIDDLVGNLTQQGNIMLSISLSKNKNTFYERSVGYSDIDQQQLANSDTIYRVGSLTKLYTSTIIMQMEEEGKLHLDQKLEHFFPGFQNGNYTTIRHLLQHTNGMFDITSDPMFFTYFQDPISRSDLLSKLQSFVPNTHPGQYFQYTNTGYILLSMIIELIDGDSFDAIVRNRIVDQIGLNRTKIGSDIDTSNNEAYSYMNMNGTWFNNMEIDLSIPLGAGALVSTPSETLKFLQALFFEKQLLVSRCTLKQMMDSKYSEMEYGLGMEILPFFDKIGYGHTGTIDNFASFSFCFKEKRICISVHVNAVENVQIVQNIPFMVLAILYDIPLEHRQLSSIDLQEWF